MKFLSTFMPSAGGGRGGVGGRRRGGRRGSLTPGQRRLGEAIEGRARAGKAPTRGQGRQMAGLTGPRGGVGGNRQAQRNVQGAFNRRTRGG